MLVMLVMLVEEESTQMAGGNMADESCNEGLARD